jgi:hypothetical protein
MKLTMWSCLAAAIIIAVPEAQAQGYYYGGTDYSARNYSVQRENERRWQESERERQRMQRDMERQQRSFQNNMQGDPFAPRRRY